MFEPAPAATSSYDQIGGGPAVRTAVDMLYTRILADPDLAHFFGGVDMPALRRHMALMLTKVLGGPDTYDGRNLTDAHRGLAITDAHYAKVGAHLIAVLEELQVPQDIVAAVTSVLLAVMSQVVVGPPASWRKLLDP